MPIRLSNPSTVYYRSMEDTDSTHRIAVRLARLVREHPGETMSMMRKRLAHRERDLFVEGCAVALHLGWVTQDEAGRLRQGHSQPAIKAVEAPTLPQRVAEVLKRLRAPEVCTCEGGCRKEEGEDYLKDHRPCDDGMHMKWGGNSDTYCGRCN